MTIDLKPEQLHGAAFRLLTAVVALMFIFSATVTSFAYSNGIKTVTVTDGTRTRSVSTRSDDPEQIVRAAGFTLAANDELSTKAFSPESGGIITINRAKTVRVIDNNKIVYCIGYNTLGNTLRDRGFGTDENIDTDIPLDENVFDGMQVVINRAFPVTVVADGEETTLYTMGSTVGGILDEAGVDVGEEDDVSHTLTSDVSDEATITVDRVEYTERTEKEEIPYETVTQTDTDMYEGDSTVVTEGVKGEKELVYKDKFVNGELDSSELVSETTVTEPVKEVVKIGAKKRPALIKFRNGVEPISDLEVPSYVKLDSNGLPKNYVDYLEGAATAYTNDPQTSTGRKPQQGIVAVDPREIPYGSELYIVSKDGQYVYGYAIAGDTGGFIYSTNNIADLYMDTYDMCCEWGRRDVAIFVISYGDGR
ncbi:MAG: G5 domain-containing protein [Clostridia bacterium]|nr:G5 domain-containing protein [Clostridia bacterium]